ncbi:MAG: GNAT family N-acetyltransferase [Gammaproteobacteria bacterium]|nr:GNAT family N-acetyltransferase [Gammaproteobacteria bacterium]
MNLIVRQAQNGDENRIAEIHISAWQKAYAGIMEDNFLASLKLGEIIDLWHQSITQVSLGSLAVVEKNGIIEGFSVFGPASDKELQGGMASELVAINICPKYWRSGMGGKLLDYVINELLSRGYEFVYLWVATENKRARAFYQAYGFICENLTKINERFSGIEETRYVLKLVTNKPLELAPNSCG